jgi:hypothetical protein
MSRRARRLNGHDHGQSSPQIRIAAKNWLISAGSRPPSEVGYVAGRPARDDAWTLPALRNYARAHGPQTLANLRIETLREWLKTDPTLKTKLKLQSFRRNDPEPGLTLPPGLKGQLSRETGAATSATGYRGAELAEPASPITLPVVKWLSRPEIPMSPRERLGSKYRDPLPAVSTEETKLIEDGEAAWFRLKQNSAMLDWIKVGRALPCGRRLCMNQIGISKPAGKYYSLVYKDWLERHHFDEIMPTSRKTCMQVVENLSDIETWMRTLSDDKRVSLNSPQVMWSQYRAHKRGKDTSHAGWRERQMTEAAFNELMDAIADILDAGGGPLELAIVAARAMGFAVPREILMDQKSYRHVIMRPRLPWSPFSLSMGDLAHG